MSFPSAALTGFAGKWYFPFAMLPPAVWISALKDNCHDPGSMPVLPKEVCETMRTRKFCGTGWTNICWEILRLHWSSLDGYSLKTHCHADSTLSSAIHVLPFGIPWYLYKNRVKKTRGTLKTIRPKMLNSNWIYTAVLWSQKTCPDLEPVSAPGGQSARSRN